LDEIVVGVASAIFVVAAVGIAVGANVRVFLAATPAVTAATAEHLPRRGDSCFDNVRVRGCSTSEKNVLLFVALLRGCMVYVCECVVSVLCSVQHLFFFREKMENTPL
jgi:hypothetical protein